MTKKTGKLIIAGNDGDPRRQAASNPYDARNVRPTAATPFVHSPKILHTSKGPIRRSAAVTTAGSPGFISGSGGAAQSVAQSPLYYDYRWSTPDKYYFPRNKIVANSIWREIYRRDAAIATGTDVYAELPWSDFDLVGLDDNDVKHIYEDMFSNLNLLSYLTEFTRDYLVLGELVLHALFDSTKGVWERVIPHNPDFIRAEGIGLVLDQPLLWLRPTPEIKRLITSDDPRVRALQKVLPREVINAVRQNREIPLDSLNTTFLARRNSASEIRGTSLYTRIYRTVMYEDFVVNASLAVSQRMAAPLRIFKLGDPNTGWLPTEDDEAAFAEMLSMAESDPMAAIVMHNNVSVDLVGVADRALLISKEWDFIERIKLLALGVAKSFLIGETSFASATAGLQTLLTRLENLRKKFEDDWIIKKLCTPIAKMHDFYKRPQNELDHRIRVKTKDEMKPMVPKIKWHKSLSPKEDPSILNSTYRDLKDRGLLSDRTYTAAAGVDLDVERKNQEEERKWVKDHPELFPDAEDVAPPKGGAPGGGGGAPKPPGGAPKQPGGEGPGGALPPPAPLPGKESGKKTASAEDSLYNDLEDTLHDLSDSDGRVYVEDILEAVHGSPSYVINRKKGKKQNNVRNIQKNRLEKRLTEAEPRFIEEPPTADMLAGK